MIAIVNMGGGDPDDILGWREYEVRINREVITTFCHKRGDGLAVCLQKAASAVESKKWRNVDDFLMQQ